MVVKIDLIVILLVIMFVNPRLLGEGFEPRSVDVKVVTPCESEMDFKCTRSILNLDLV